MLGWEEKMFQLVHFYRLRVNKEPINFKKLISVGLLLRVWNMLASMFMLAQNPQRLSFFESEFNVEGGGYRGCIVSLGLKIGDLRSLISHDDLEMRPYQRILHLS